MARAMRLPLLLLAMIFAGLLFAMALPANAAIFVCVDGNDSWSGQLALPNKQKTDGPVASLERACRLARQQKDKTVIVGKGVYFLSRPLELGPEDRGLRLTAAAGVRPVISGGVILSDWKQEPGGLWSAAAPSSAVLPVRLVRAGLHWLPVSRFPQSGSDPAKEWLMVRLSAGNDGASNTEIKFQSGELPNWASCGDIEAIVFPVGWANQILSVDSIDYQRRILSFQTSRNTQNKLVPGTRYYLRNIKEEIRKPGQWCFESGSGRIFLRLAPDGKPGQIIVPALKQLIRIVGRPALGQFAQDITISGFEFRDCAYSENFNMVLPLDCAVLMSGAADCKVAGNLFATCGGSAVRLEQQSRDNTISGNTMTELGGAAVIMVGTSQDQARNTSISGNRISDCGRVFKHVAGVMADSASGCLISGNRIENMPRSGVSIKSRTSTSISRQNIVEENTIINSNKETNDSGAVEVLGRGKIDTGDIIRHNYIRSSGGFVLERNGAVKSPFQSFGIYLDDFASGIKIEKNILIDCNWAGVMIHGGRNNEVYNNYFLGNADAAMLLAPADDSFMKGNSFYRNLVCLNNPKAALITSKIAWQPSELRLCDFNLYWNTVNRDFAASAKPTPAGSFQQWLSLGFDRQSIIADPQLNGFAFAPSSPARTLGITPLSAPAQPGNLEPR